MAKYNFSDTERFAIYTVHQERCYMCRKPIDLQSMQVDHILPEYLLSNPTELHSVLAAFGLSKDFEINSYENWMPSCGPCNRRKGRTVFDPTPLIQLELQMAISVAGKVRALVDKALTKREISKALNILKRVNEEGKLNNEIIRQLQPLVEFLRQERSPELTDTPIKLSPLFEVLSEADGIRIVKGPYGIGGRPIGSGLSCPNCGTIGAWNGTRCVICGLIDDE